MRLFSNRTSSGGRTTSAKTTSSGRTNNSVPPMLDNLVAWFKPDIDLLDHHPEDREVRSVQSGRAITLNGATGFLSIPQASNTYLDWDSTQPFTIAFWINTTSASTQYVWSKYDTAGNQRGIAILVIGAVIVMKLVNSAVGSSLIQSTFGGILANGGTLGFTVNQGNWIHVTLTYDGSGLATGMKCYFNGYNAGRTTTGTLTGTVANTKPWSTSANGGTILNGSIFDLRMYNEVKTQEESVNIYNGNLEERGLLVRLLLDEQTGTTFYNSYKTASQIGTFGQTVGDASHSNIVGLTHITQPIYSWQNNFGYNTNAGVFKPRNYAVSSLRGSTGVDASGTTLTFYKPVRYRITNVAGVINFNPDLAPLSKIQSDNFISQPFRALPLVPTAYTAGATTFSWDEITNPLYVDRSNGNETNFLIYRDELSWYKRGAVTSFINMEHIVFIQAGQSNGFGQGTNTSELTAPYTATLANVWWFDHTNNVMTQYIGTTGNQFAAELSACYDIATSTNKRVHLIKFAVFGTPIHDDLVNPFWSTSYGTTGAYLPGRALYPTLVQHAVDGINLMYNSGRKVKHIIVNFDQGEADCTASLRSFYQAELKSLITTFRTNIASRTRFKGIIPWIHRRLSTNQTGLDVTSLTVLRQALVNIANPVNADYVPNFYWFDSDSNVVQVDHIHLTGVAQQANGQAVSAILIANGLLT